MARLFCAVLIIFCMAVCSGYKSPVNLLRKLPPPLSRGIKVPPVKGGVGKADGGLIKETSSHGISFDCARPENLFFPPETLTIVATGDIMLDRNVRVFQEQHGFLYPFFNVLPLLWRADFRTGNLESMISDKGHPMDKKYIFHAPPENMKLLTLAGFDCLSVANNHAFDWFGDAFCDCLDRLGKAGITFVGGGQDFDRMSRAAYFYRKGTLIGVLGINDTPTNFMGKTNAGVMPSWREVFEKDALAAVRRAAPNCDLLLVHVHWGHEDTLFPSGRQIALGHALIEAGADVVIGHHPHRLQGVEFFTAKDGRTGVIAYSLGNFVFDQNDHLNNLSAALFLDVQNGCIKSVRLKPLEMLTAPRAVSPAEGALFNEIAALMENCSEPFGTKVFADNEWLYLMPSGEN